MARLEPAAKAPTCMHLAPKQCRPVCNHRIANKTMNHVCTQAGVLTLNMYGYFNALAIMAAVLIWARVLHMRLQHALIYDPLTVFHNSTEDMDANEVTGLPCCLTNLCHLDYLTTMLKTNLAPYTLLPY